MTIIFVGISAFFHSGYGRIRSQFGILDAGRAFGVVSFRLVTSGFWLQFDSLARWTHQPNVRGELDCSRPVCVFLGTCCKQLRAWWDDTVISSLIRLTLRLIGVSYNNNSSNHFVMTSILSSKQMGRIPASLLPTRLWYSSLWRRTQMRRKSEI